MGISGWWGGRRFPQTRRRRALRDNTERPITVEMGTNHVVGQDPERIVSAYHELSAGGAPETRIPPLWGGRAAQRIVGLLRDAL